MKTVGISALLLALGLQTGACREEIDPDSLSVSIDGYTEWDSIDPLLGDVPGHGNTYRIMYRNDIAQSYTGSGEYPLGSAIVKEIYGLEGADGRGGLRYKAVMRRIDQDESPDLPIDGGWLFTKIDSGTQEFYGDSCWGTCHNTAPFAGAFFDHSN